MIAIVSNCLQENLMISSGSFSLGRLFVYPELFSLQIGSLGSYGGGVENLIHEYLRIWNVVTVSINQCLQSFRVDQLDLNFFIHLGPPGELA